MRPKIALIGIGMWGQNLARVLYNLKALEIICDTNSKSQIRAKKKYPKTKVVGDIRSILKDKNIEGVVIATPPSTHAALAKKMLQAGKHVMVEKPLALSVSDGKEMTALAKKLKRVFMVGHVLEYHPAVVKLRELMKQGKLGKLQYIYSHRLNFGKIRTEENALWSFAPHDVAILLRLMRIPPTSVSCSGHASIHSDVADSTVTTLHFSNGVQAHMYVSWLHPFKIQRLVLIGDKQMAVFDDTKDWSEKLVLFSHRVDWVDGRIPVARKAKGIKVKLQEKEPLKVECEHFLKCIQSRQTPFTDGASGVEVLKVLEAAQKSIQESGTPIYPNASHKPSSKKLRYFAHTTAVVDKGAKIGEGTKVWHYSHVMSGSKIGNKCILGQNCFVGPGVSIGNGVKVQNNVSIYEGVSLEDHVFCGPSVVFTNVMNPRSAIERKTEFRKTMVKRGATLGAHSTIVCGNTIGRYAFVGADALVTKDIPDYALVLGSPARVVSWMCECGIKLKFKKAKATCKACHKKYQQLKSGKVKKTT